MVEVVPPLPIEEPLEGAGVLEGNEVSPTMAEDGLPTTGVEEPTTVVEALSPMTIAESVVGDELVEDSGVSSTMLEEMPSTTTDEAAGTEEPVEGGKEVAP